MTYLERLKAKKTFVHAESCTDRTDKSLPQTEKNISQPYGDELTELTKAPSVSFVSAKGKESESFFSNSANDPPPFPTGNHQDKSWGQWNGYLVGATDSERADALAEMPDNWRYHVQKHLDGVNLLRKRAEGRS